MKQRTYSTVAFAVLVSSCLLFASPAVFFLGNNGYDYKLNQNHVRAVRGGL